MQKSMFVIVVCKSSTKVVENIQTAKRLRPGCMDARYNCYFLGSFSLKLGDFHLFSIPTEKIESRTKDTVLD